MERKGYAIKVAYEGGAFHGWQRQPGFPTVQQTLEEGLIALGIEARLVAAARTDSGVSARAQVVSFRLRRRLIGSELLAPLQALLPSTLRLLSWAEVGPSFHARASALAREYRYRLGAPSSEFDANAARHFLAGLLGTQDRRPYVWRPVRPTLSTLHAAELRPESDGLEFRFVADRYGRRQVRNMVWAALAAGCGEPLGASAERGWTGETAPAEALTLWHVTYEPDPFLETG